MYTFDENKEYLYICSNNKKEVILNQINKEKKLFHIKFMTIEEFKQEYFFKYDINIYPYIMEKYNISYNTTKEYLENLYYIDIKKNYTSHKLERLKKIKEDLIKNNYLQFNDSFKSYLATKKIIVDVYLLDPFIKSSLDTFETEFINYKARDTHLKIIKYDDVETEINSTIIKIIKLISKGIPLSKIYIVNINNEHNYLLKKLFKLYNIPINTQERISLNTVLFIKEYFLTNKIPDLTEDNREIVKTFVTLLNKYKIIENSIYYKLIIKEELKNTYIPNKIYSESVNVCSSLEELENLQDSYVFLLGFNEGILPVIKKDEDFLNDQEKITLGVLDSVLYNSLNKENIYIKLTNIDDLTMSFFTHGFSEEYFPSSIIEDYNIEIVSNIEKSYNYSNKYNKRKLNLMLDNYNKYGEIDKDLFKLLSTYPDNLYNTYNHKFSGIDKHSYIEFIKKTLALSYSSVNLYNLCPFSYYIKYILKVDPFEDTFSTFIGNLYHYILSLCFSDNFDFELSFENYLQSRNLSHKEQFLISRLKNELITIINVLKEQKMYTDFKEAYYEKEIRLSMNRNDVEVSFMGVIDKLLYYQNGNDTYYSIIDYKTGSFPSNLYYMKYGLDMQLAFYIYLVEKSNLFDNPIFTGCYFQKTTLGNINKSNSKTLEEIINDKLKLRGYSTTNVELLKLFDHNYTKSNLISGMSVTDKGFGRYSKILSEEDIYNMIKYTDKIIKDDVSNILDAKFSIEPKVIDGKSKGCMYCKYRDLCFKDIKDNIELPRVEDFSFLGDENDEK